MKNKLDGALNDAKRLKAEEIKLNPSKRFKMLIVHSFNAQGVCNSPRALINGILSEIFSATIHPPACLPRALFCLNRTWIGAATSGWASINALNVFE